MVAQLRRYWVFLLILIVDLVIAAVRPQIGLTIFGHSWRVITQMLSLLPPVFILMGLLDVWVPRQTVMRFVGERSGVLGTVICLVLGAASTGQLYGAFPVVQTMAAKGASFFNIMVLIGAWSALRIPMFVYELSSLGPRFAVTRWAANILGIVGMAWILNRVLGAKDKAHLMRPEDQV